MSKEIKMRIDALYEEAEKLIDPATFVLNPRINEINHEVKSLQAQCNHSFVNGVCEFCYRGDCNE